MGLKDLLFGNRKARDDDLCDGFAQTFAATSTQPSAADSEMRKNLDIDIHTIEDEGITNIIDRLCEGIPYKEIVYDKDGKPAVVQVTENGVDKFTPVTVEHRYFLPWAPALRVAISKVLSTRHIDNYDVETDKLKLRNEFARIKRTMNRRDRAVFTPLINIVLLYCETALDDARNGRKMLALKVQRKDLTVGLVRNQKGAR